MDLVVRMLRRQAVKFSNKKKKKTHLHICTHVTIQKEDKINKA